MSIYPKDNAVGVDAEINRFIRIIDKQLNTVGGWDIDIYHKIYREYMNDKAYPYAFVGGKDYQEVFVNDKSNGEVGFYLTTTRTIDTALSVNCDVIFSIDLDKIDNGSLQREDEKAILLALEAVDKCSDVTSVKTGLDNVFKGFSTKDIKRGDMQPFLNFSFSIEIEYNKNYCYGM